MKRELKIYFPSSKEALCLLFDVFKVKSACNVREGDLRRGRSDPALPLSSPRQPRPSLPVG